MCKNDEEFAAEASQRILDAIEFAVSERGLARVALSAGTTPLGTYLALAERGRLEDVEWFFVDERCVAPDDERSNYGAVRRALFLPAGIDTAKIFRIAGELPPRAAAATYEAVLCARFGVSATAAVRPDADGRSPLSFDVLVAGVGTDGHTASLFPGTDAVGIDEALVVDVTPRGGLEPRVSLTRPVLIAARRIFVFAKGMAKRPIVAAARQRGSDEEIPARLYLDARAGAVTWIVDRDAAPNPVSVPPQRA